MCVMFEIFDIFTHCKLQHTNKFFELENIFIKLRVVLYGWAQIQTFTTKKSARETVLQTINVYHLL